MYKINLDVRRTMSQSEQSEAIDWDGVVQQIFEFIGSDTAIIDRYGIILASRVPGFEKTRLISPLVWQIIQQRKKLMSELGVESIDGMVLETEQGNFVFTFGHFIYLMTKVSSTVDLSQFMPSIKRFITALDKSSDKTLTLSFIDLNLDKEFSKLSHEDGVGAKNENMPIFKHLIKHLAKSKKKKK